MPWHANSSTFHGRHPFGLHDPLAGLLALAAGRRSAHWASLRQRRKAPSYGRCGRCTTARAARLQHHAAHLQENDMLGSLLRFGIKMGVLSWVFKKVTGTGRTPARGPVRR